MTTKNDAQLVAVLTGAGRGIGRAIAKKLAAEGYALELTNLDETELATTAQELGAAVLYAEACDLSNREATDRWLAGLQSRHESFDVLVLNAGVGGPDPEDDDAALAHLQQVCAVNAEAPFRIVRALAPQLRSDGRGRVILMASVLGKMGVAGFSAYCASKAATIGLGRALALELAPRRITVNSLCPGWTDTAMAQQGFEAIGQATGKSPAAARQEVEKNLPLGRIVQPSEVASLVAWFASADAGAISGQAITMSAGDLQK